MKIQKLISALAHATPANPLGQDSLLPYWDFFWTAQEKETFSSDERIRIFLLHIFLLYFNDKAETSAVFMTIDWPDWMIAIARRHTREAVGVYRVSDSKAASTLVAEQGLANFGWFSDAGPYAGSRMNASDGAHGLRRRWPRGAAHLMIFPCPVLGDFSDRIAVSQDEAKGTVDSPHLWPVVPYGIMIGFIE